MLQDTSLHAWEIVQHKIWEKQKVVLDKIRLLPNVTNAELSVMLGWEINRVTPRVKELREMGLVLDAGKRICRHTGSTVHAWKAKHPILPSQVYKSEVTQRLI